MKRVPFYDTTLSQELFGDGDKIAVRVPCHGDWPVCRWILRIHAKEARRILAEQQAGRLTDHAALAAIEALE